jgi:hypothetical protein
MTDMGHYGVYCDLMSHIWDIILSNDSYIDHGN